MASPTVIDAAWTFDDQNTAQNGRYVMGSFFLNSASATAANSLWRDGVLPGVFSGGAYQGYRVSQNSPTGSSVLVQPGHAIVTRTGQGVYVCPNSTTRVVALDPANATNPRIDLIVLQVLDQPLGDPVTQAQVRAVTGVASGSPVAPATPTGAIVLAQVAVAAAPTGNTIVDANITDLRKSTGLNGGVRIMLPGDLVTDAGVPGDFRYTSATGTIDRYTSSGGGVWQPMARTNQGFGYWDKVTFNANGGVTSGTTELVARTRSFNALANRRYKVTAHVGYSPNAASTAIWRLRWATGGSVTSSGTEFAVEKGRFHTGGAFDGYTIIGEFTGPSTAQLITVGATLVNFDGTATTVFGASDNLNYILIEDIGGV